MFSKFQPDSTSTTTGVDSERTKACSSSSSSSSSTEEEELVIVETTVYSQKLSPRSNCSSEVGEIVSSSSSSSSSNNNKQPSTPTTSCDSPTSNEEQNQKQQLDVEFRSPSTEIRQLTEKYFSEQQIDASAANTTQTINTGENGSDVTTTTGNNLIDSIIKLNSDIESTIRRQSISARYLMKQQSQQQQQQQQQSQMNDDNEENGGREDEGDENGGLAGSASPVSPVTTSSASSVSSSSSCLNETIVIPQPSSSSASKVSVGNTVRKLNDMRSSDGMVVTSTTSSNNAEGKQLYY